MKKQIKLFSPKFDKKEIIAAAHTLKSSHWASGDGQGLVSEFEKRFQNYTKAGDCVAVNNGSAALHLALSLLKISGKEVLVPSLTFVTTVHSIVYNGGIPVFVDVDPSTLCIDPKDLKKKITKKTKAIIPVHYGGFPCDLDSIREIAEDTTIHIIEDAAHACGTKYHGKRIGTHSEFVCFSFHPVKNLAMPKGGAITINSRNNPSTKKKLNSLRWCGIVNRKGSHYDVNSLGFNYYMDEISAAIGIEQLKKLDKSNSTRLKIAKRYTSELNVLQKMPLNEDCCYHLYWIRVKNRDSFRRKMYKMGIETGTHYKPVHSMSYYNSKISLPITDMVGRELVTLPMHPNLTNDDIDKIIKATNSFI